MVQHLQITLPETKIAPENGWLEYDRFLLGRGLLSGAFAVSLGSVVVRECSWKALNKISYCQRTFR